MKYVIMLLLIVSLGVGYTFYLMSKGLKST